MLASAALVCRLQKSQMIAMSLLWRRTMKYLAMGLTFLSLTTPSAYGQKGVLPVSSGMHIDIAGYVLPAPGELVLPESVSVTLNSRENELTITKNVPMSGSFMFEDLYPGYYSIKVDCPGYEPKVSNVQIGQRNFETISVSLALGKRLAKNSVPPRSSPKTVDT